MMHQPALPMGVSLGALLLLAGCGAMHHCRAELGQRFQQQLGPALADRQVALQPLPQGVRLVVAEDALFSPGGATLTGHGRAILARAIESLLAPPLLHIDIGGPPGIPTPLQQARVQAVSDFLLHYQLGPALQPASMEAQTTAAGTPEAALSMTVTLRRHG